MNRAYSVLVLSFSFHNSLSFFCRPLLYISEFWLEWKRHISPVQLWILYKTWNESDNWIFDGWNCATSLAPIQWTAANGQLWIKVVLKQPCFLITFRSANRELIVIRLWVEDWEAKRWEDRDGRCTAVDVPNRAVGELEIEHVLFSCGGATQALLCIIEVYHCAENRSMHDQSMFSFLWSCNKMKTWGKPCSTPILWLIVSYKCQ